MAPPFSYQDCWPSFLYSLYALDLDSSSSTRWPPAALLHLSSSIYGPRVQFGNEMMSTGNSLRDEKFHNCKLLHVPQQELSVTPTPLSPQARAFSSPVFTRRHRSLPNFLFPDELPPFFNLLESFTTTPRTTVSEPRTVFPTLGFWRLQSAGCVCVVNCLFPVFSEQYVLDPGSTLHPLVRTFHYSPLVLSFSCHVIRICYRHPPYPR